MRAQKLTKETQDAYAEPMRLRAHIYGKIASAAAGKEIRVFGLEQALSDRFDTLTKRIRRERDRASWGGAGWLMLGDAAFMAAYVAAIGWVVIRAARGEIGVGDVVLTATMAGALVGAIAMVVMIGQYLPFLLLTIERFHWLEDFAAAEPAAPRRPRRRRRRRRPCSTGMELDSVSFTYPDREVAALSDISLSLPAGAVIALVGENGSGKSTLVKLLCGFYRPTAAASWSTARTSPTMPIEAWRGRVCAAFQDYANFEFQMHESVGVGELAHLGRRRPRGRRARPGRRRGAGRAAAGRPRRHARTQVGRRGALRRPMAEAGAGPRPLPRAAAAGGASTSPPPPSTPRPSTRCSPASPRRPGRAARPAASPCSSPTASPPCAWPTRSR